MTRILIADDSPHVRRALRNLVEEHDENWEVCGEATDGRQAVQRATETNPDLIVIDFQMPIMDGLHAATEIAKRQRLQGITSRFVSTPEEYRPDHQRNRQDTAQQFSQRKTDGALR